MKITLKELDNLRCTDYVKQHLDGMPYLSNRIAHDIDFNSGRFYVIIPENINPEYPVPDYYDFGTGGRIYPFHREDGETVRQQINESEDLIREAAIEYINADLSNCLCLEDFNAKPHYPYIINSKREYYLIEDNILYLIDNKMTLEEIDGDFNSSIGYGFICMTLNIPKGLNTLSLTTNKTISDEAKDFIFRSINSFFIEIYDNESYLIWVKDPEENYFFDILNKKMVSHE